MKSATYHFLFYVILLCVTTNCIILLTIADIPQIQNVSKKYNLNDYESRYAAEYKMGRVPLRIILDLNRRVKADLLSLRVTPIQRNNRLMYCVLKVPTNKLDYYLFCLQAYGASFNRDDLTTTEDDTLLFLKIHYYSNVANMLFTFCMLCNLMLPLIFMRYVETNFNLTYWYERGKLKREYLIR